MISGSLLGSGWLAIFQSVLEGLEGYLGERNNNECKGLCQAPIVEQESKLETPCLELGIYLALSREEMVSVQRTTGNRLGRSGALRRILGKDRKWLLAQIACAQPQRLPLSHKAPGQVVQATVHFLTRLDISKTY